MKGFRRFILGLALVAGLAGLTPTPAQAWWHGGWHAGWGGGWHAGWGGGWGWHPGWGWHGGVWLGGPVVAGAPAYYPYAAPHLVPGHYTPWGAWVPPHWGYY